MMLANPFWIALLGAFAAYFLYAGFNRRAKERAVKTAFEERMEQFNQQAELSDDAMMADASQAFGGEQKPGFLTRLGEQLRDTSMSGRHGQSLVQYLDRQLELAGYPNNWQVTDFISRYMLLAGGALLGGGLLAQSGAFPVYLYLPLVGLCVSYPLVWLKKRIQARQEQAFAELPSFLDDIILGLSSGTTMLDKALREVVMDETVGVLNDSQRVLVQEFRRAYIEASSMSLPREQAFRAAAERLQIQEVDDLVDILLEGFEGSETTLHNLRDMSTHVYKVFEQNMVTLIKKKDTPMTTAVVIVMFSATLLIGAPIMITLIEALSGGVS